MDGGAVVGAGGAEAGGKRPRARSAAINGFSVAGMEAGCGVLLATGICGRMLWTWGGGVGCWRAAVALISSANVPGLRSC